MAQDRTFALRALMIGVGCIVSAVAVAVAVAQPLDLSDSPWDNNRPNVVADSPWDSGGSNGGGGNGRGTIPTSGGYLS